ncbi:uncharacterized protein J3D65DRAFT_20831 [Phyllosticta citribraziliensis]|uniref:Uncharacterized protein n=1 Tax=Phyllosticta citribraziliensis TaxID=989973 RepID=A0ABR1MCC9_9PEZI
MSVYSLSLSLSLCTSSSARPSLLCPDSAFSHSTSSACICTRALPSGTTLSLPCDEAHFETLTSIPAPMQLSSPACSTDECHKYASPKLSAVCCRFHVSVWASTDSVGFNRICHAAKVSFDADFLCSLSNRQSFLFLFLFFPFLPPFSTLSFSPPSSPTWLYASIPSTQRQSGAFCWHGNWVLLRPAPALHPLRFDCRLLPATPSLSTSCPPCFSSSHRIHLHLGPGLPHHASAFSSPPVPPLTGEAGGLQRNASTQRCHISRPSLPLHHMCGVASMSPL